VAALQALGQGGKAWLLVVGSGGGQLDVEMKLLWSWRVDGVAVLKCWT